MSRRISKFLLLLSCTALACISMSTGRRITPVAASTAKKKAPNIVLLIIDDLGYSDIDIYGGEIQTPNLDTLAKQGVMFTNYHSMPSCSPTRAELISGADNHEVGLGTMEELLDDNQKWKPGYEGYLNDKALPISEILKDVGYHTYMVGKWHLGHDLGYLPADRGFEQSFALLEGGANHFLERGLDTKRRIPHYTENGKVAHLPKNFYSSTFFTDKMIEYIDKNHGDGKPFFAYTAYTAPHEPFQAPQENIKKFLGKYNIGWDKLREQRFNRMKQMGLIPHNLKLPRRWSQVPAWDSLSPEKQRYEAKKMAIYAAMIDKLDSEIGRLISHLKQIGEYDNTVFITFSDNGAAGQDFPNDPNNKEAYDRWFASDKVDNSYANIGNGTSFVAYGLAWAEVGTTPFLWSKGRISEGGTRSDALITYPGVVKSGVRTNALSFAVDFAPTILDYAGVKHPGTTYKGKPVAPLKGHSLRPILEGKAKAVYGPNEPVGVELYGIGNSALYMGDWKILKLNGPWGDNQWHLFNLLQDPRELHDLSEEYPEQLNKMIPLYEEYEKKEHIVPALGKVGI